MRLYRDDESLFPPSFSRTLPASLRGRHSIKCRWLNMAFFTPRPNRLPSPWKSSRTTKRTDRWQLRPLARPVSTRSEVRVVWIVEIEGDWPQVVVRIDQ